MLTAETRLAPDPDVLFTKLATGEAVLLHMGTKSYFSLNETGAFIWSRLSENLTIGDISSRIEDVFDVTAEDAEKNVISLLDDLVEADLVHVSEAVNS